MINRLTIEEGFTQSELATLSACPEMWNNRYNLRLTKPGSFAFPLMIGSEMHTTLEQIYRTNFERWSVATLQFPEGAIPTLNDIAKAEKWNAILPAMMKAYVMYWKENDIRKFEVISFEQELKVVYKGFILRGKVDLRTRLRTKAATVGIWDHKSTFRLDNNIVTGWDFRFQFLFYIWMTWIADPKTEVKGYFVNAIKKPELKPKKTESLEAFGERVFADMIEEPEKYFYREYYPISKEVLLHFQTAVVDPKIARLQLGIDRPDLFDTLFHDKNTDRCTPIGYAPCQYIDLCRHGHKEMGFLYTTNEHKHQELNDTEE